MWSRREKRAVCRCAAGSFAAILLCIGMAGGTARASEGSRRQRLISRGAVSYGGGRVVIDAADLAMLADETDRLELSFKTDLFQALAQIGTYIRTDGGLSHDARTEEDPTQIAFRDLVNGIRQSQSLAHLADTQASGGAGPLFYKFETNNLLETTGDDTGMPVYIRPATEDNLSAGTAAWAEGRCLVGNGSDNYYFYQKGFIEGYAAKVGARVEYRYDETGRMESARLVFP